MARITVIQIEHNKEEGNYALYGLGQHGICLKQAFFPYQRGTRAAARAKAQRCVHIWADESKARIEEQ
jgi:hypothetical protein